MLRKSEDFKDIALALCKAQGEFKVAIKDALNPHLRTHYADIESIHEASNDALAKHELALIQTHGRDVDADGIPGAWILVTTIIHSSGQWFETTYPLHVTKNDAQGFAAATTYARRVSWATICRIVAKDEDDDGEENSGDGMNPLGQPVSAQAVYDLERNKLASEWAKAEARFIGRMDVAQIEKWRVENEKTLKRLLNNHADIYAELMGKVAAREASFNAVPLDTPKPVTPPPAADAPAAEAEKFQRRLDDLGVCDQLADVDELDQTTMDWLNQADLTDFMARWTVAANTKRRAIKSRAVTASKGPMKA